ncbi:MAG TPA: nickel insertion protein, partial [Geobacteraceae bacterium]|nr:nickel insertion protein [Geobacteraceae bacterium]
VPAPATMELLQGVPIYSTEVKGELVTPTGAALIRHFSKGFAPMPQMIVEHVGYGAGSKDFGIPNLLRATIGTVTATAEPI